MTLPAPQYNIGTAQPNGVQQYCLKGMYVGFLGDGGGANNNNAMNGLEAHIGDPIECIMGGAGFGGIGTRLALVDSNNPRHIVLHYNGMPSGGTLAAAAAGSYDATWIADATAIKNSKYNTAQLTILPWWEASAYGNGNFDWAIGHGSNTAAQFVSAWQRMHNTFLGVSGFSTSVTWACNFWSQQLTTAMINAAYPGDAYVDIVDWDGYAGDSSGNLSKRGDYQWVWDNYQKPGMDQLTAFCRAHGKMAGMSEYGQVQPIPSDTTSNTYVYASTAPNALYYKLMHDYVRDNADVWAYLCMFNANVPQPAGVTHEEDQLFFQGTNPATQNASYYHSTDANNGAWYDTIAPSQQIPLASYKAVMIAGTMQLPEPVTPTTQVSSTGTRVFNFSYPFG